MTAKRHIMQAMLAIPALSLVAACGVGDDSSEQAVDAPALTEVEQTTTEASPTAAATSSEDPSPTTSAEEDARSGASLRASTAEDSVEIRLSMGEFLDFDDGETVPRDRGNSGQLKPQFVMNVDGTVPEQEYCSYEWSIRGPDGSVANSGESNGLTECERGFGDNTYGGEVIHLREPGEYTVEFTGVYLGGEELTATRSFRLV